MTVNNLDTLIAKLDYIDVKINATHLNYVNGNNLLYTIDAATTGGVSWLEPYAKPQLLHHDKKQDAVGRIVSYDIKDKATIKGEPKDYIELTSRITDSVAISKVIKSLYFTCSVGSSTSKVRCSICNQVLTTDGLCEHEKGSLVDGKQVYWIIDNISYRENSFVNNPADLYSRIISIDIGDGFIPFDKFLKDKENILTGVFLEDDMSKNTYKKLTADTRANLAASVFCGPDNSFPAHDEAHVTAGLKLLEDSELTDSVKLKIKGSLYRKGKRFEVVPSEDELKQTSDLLIYRMEDDFTEDEMKELSDYFKTNPDSDLPSIEDSEEETSTTTEKVTYTIDSYDEVIKGEKSEIISFCDYLVKEVSTLKDEIETLTITKTELTNKTSEQDTILNSKEDEIQKMLDDNATLTVSFKKALIDNILDFKQIVENQDEEFKKYDSRQIDSLTDTLSDFRNESVTSIPRVEDETLTDDQLAADTEENDSGENTTDIDDNQEESKIDRFFKNN